MNLNSSLNSFARVLALRILTIFFGFLIFQKTNAQVAQYVFTPSAGTYTPLVAPINIFPSGWDDNTAVSVPLGFTLTFNGVGYTSVFVHPNGYLTFGASTTVYVPISGVHTATGVISAYGRDLQAQNTAPLGSVDYVATATDFTVQWSNTRRYNGTTINTERFEMQIQLIQATGVIKFIYGTWSDAVNAANTTIGEVGLRGASAADFRNFSVLSGGSWAAPSAGLVNTATCFYNEANVATKPALGQTYTFVPPVPCTTPANQPTSMLLTPGVISISGSFTAAPSSPYGYLTVRTLTNVPPSPPVNGTLYTAGQSALGGVIVSTASSTSFVATGLTPATTYYFWTYSYNNFCTGGGAPFYQVVAPLTASATTGNCTITGTRSVGPTGFYLTLTAAITDLNTNGLAGPVILELQPTYLSSAEPAFPVVIPELPCISAVNNLTIRPQAGASALSITSASAVGTLNFDGGDFVTIDGRAGGVGVSQLTISNTNLAGYAIQLINSATFNTYKFCKISGINSGTSSGVIFFNTAVGFASGNSNNIIDNCELRDDISTPTNLIYCSGNVLDYASQNNNNTVSNCLIHDWFNASSTVLSAAINIVGGASDWSITGNSFYQSVTRTFTMTTATNQGAISINSAVFGSNFTITSNFFGGSAPLCAGAAWNYLGTGTTGQPSLAMLRINSAISAFSNVSNNTFSNISITTASVNAFQGLIAHLNGNININNNTIGSQTTTGNITYIHSSTSTATVFMPIGVGTSTLAQTINVTNNNIGSITVSSTSTGTVNFRCIYGQPPIGSFLNITNNTIGGTVANSIQQLSGSATAQTGVLKGINVLNPSLGAVVSNNIIRNLTITTTFAGPVLVGIDFNTTGGNYTITNNSIFNLTTNSTNININNIASVNGLVMAGTGAGETNVSNNTIHSLTNTNTTVAGWINGMYFSTANAPLAQTIISKNFIHSINLASAITGAGMVGIFLPNAGIAQVNNNMVRLGIDASGASITNGLQINGIQKNSTGTMGIYYNTVYIGGSGVVSGTVNSYAFRRGASTLGSTLDTVMNNIFYNARSNASGTGKHYAINTNANTLLFSNYNDLFANGTGGVLGINVATDYATLDLWRTANNQDWNSVSADPILVNPTGTSTTVDLHIGVAATPVERAAYNLAQVTDDFDAQTRSTLTPSDIGADAGNFTLSDVSAPVIYLTPLLLNTCSTGDRILSGINITDATGVSTSGTLRPRIYYRKGAGTYFSQPGTLSSGSGTNGIWSFTIVAADMGGLAPADIVSYYIIAQDLAGTPNIASNFGGAIATDVNTITTHPTTPNTFTVLAASLSGTYNVGVGQTYATLTAAVAAYNTACITGAVTFLLTDLLYSASETFPITINSNPFASSINTLTIKPVLAGTAITGTSATALIVLNGADWVTINGSISGVNNTLCPFVAASRDLTITNSNVSTASAVIWLQSTLITATPSLDGASNNSIRNINLVGSGNTQTFVGVGSGSTIISTLSLGVNNHNNSYVNNNISKTQYGIFSQGASIAAKNQGTVIRQNLVNTLAPNNVRRAGVYAGFENSIDISGNNISEIASTTTVEDVFGITCGSVTITTSTFIGNEVTNATITMNKIGSVRQTVTYSACGIFLASALSGTNQISNNMISGVSSNGTAGDFSVGMFLGGGQGSTTQVYYNTITMTSIPVNTGATDKSFALAIAGANPIVDVRNNILINSQNNGTANNYAIAYGYTPFTNLTSSNNDYYVAGGATFFIGGTGSIAAPTNQLTLTNLQAITGKDGAGLNTLPVFVSAIDLHLVNPGNACMESAGTPITGITTDIDCQTRNVTKPDIGADEFTATDFPTFAFTESSGFINNDGIICLGASVNFTTSGGSSYLWSTGETTANIIVTPIITTTYTVSITLAAGCVKVFSQTITVVPNPTAGITPAVALICLGQTQILTGTGGATYLWNTGETTVSISKSPVTTTTYTVTVTNASGCTNSASRIVTVSIPTASISPAAPSVCIGQSTTLTASGGGTYLWSTGANTAAITVTPAISTIYTVTVTNASGCTATSSALVTVNPLPIAGISPVAPTVCIGSSTTLTGTGGGTYLWSTGANTTSISVSPIVNTTYTVTVTSGLGCTASATKTVTVLTPPTLSSTKVEPTTCFAPNGSINLTVAGGIPLVTYSWTGPAGFTAITEDISGLIVGNYNVTVTSGNGCTATTSIFLAGPGGCVSGVISISDPCVCKNNATTLQNGQFGEQVKVTGLPNQTWTVTSSTGLYLTTSAPPPAAPTPIPNGTTLIESPPGSAMYVLNGVHVDSIGYVVSVTDGSLILTIGDTCYYPNPIFMSLDTAYCKNAPAVTLMAKGFLGNGTNAPIGGTSTFMVDGITATQLIPVNLSAGLHVVMGNFDADSLNIKNRGCIQKMNQNVQINALGTVIATRDTNTCAGRIHPGYVFTGTPVGMVSFSWRKTSAVGGAATTIAAVGTGNIPLFVTTNSGCGILTDTIFVTPSNTRGNCAGIVDTFLIRTAPTPTATQIRDTSMCNAQMWTPPAFTGNCTAQTIYRWVKKAGPGGTNLPALALSGVGNLPKLTVVNAPPSCLILTDTIITTPIYLIPGSTDSCVGTPMKFIVKSVPMPVISAKPDVSYCANTAQAGFTMTSNCTVTVQRWKKTTVG
ncbi:MAG: hypothetical protein ABI851_13770, partial [Saprospiraceae bacterium]